MGTIPRYMAKEEGRKAGAAVDIPQLVTSRMSVLRAICGPNLTAIDLPFCVSVYIHTQTVLSMYMLRIHVEADTNE